MADVAVDSYANTVPPHKKQLSSSIPNIESLEGIGAGSDDQYSTFKKLQRQLECAANCLCDELMLTRLRYIKLQEEYIKDEQRSLKRELVRAQEEIKRIQSVPLVIGQFMEAIDQKCVSLISDKLSHANQPQHRHRTIVHWIQLCRAHSFNTRS